MASHSPRELKLITLRRFAITAKFARSSAWPVGVFGLIAALGACSPSSSNRSTTSVEIAGSDYSCELQPHEGESAEAPTHTDLKTLFFGKSIDLAKLEPLYKASGLATVQYMETQGIRVRGVSRKNPARCRRYEFLPSASGAELGLWREMESEINDATSNVAGAFFPAGNVTSGVPFDRPTILVGFDSHRRVLVHEYIHYMYQLEAAKTPGYRHAQDLLSELDSVGNELGFGRFTRSEVAFRLEALSSGQTLENVAKALAVFEKILTHFTLEEIAIEAQFLDDYGQRRYEWVVDHRGSAIKYMESSLDKANELHRRVSQFTEAVLGKIEKRVWECTTSSRVCSAQEAERLRADQSHSGKVASLSRRLRALLNEGSTVVNARVPLSSGRFALGLVANRNVGVASGPGMVAGTGLFAGTDGGPSAGLGIAPAPTRIPETEARGTLAPGTSDSSAMLPPCRHPAAREIERYILGR